MNITEIFGGCFLCINPFRNIIVKVQIIVTAVILQEKRPGKSYCIIKKKIAARHVAITPMHTG